MSSAELSIETAERAAARNEVSSHGKDTKQQIIEDADDLQLVSKPHRKFLYAFKWAIELTHNQESIGYKPVSYGPGRAFSVCSSEFLDSPSNIWPH